MITLIRFFIFVLCLPVSLLYCVVRTIAKEAQMTWFLCDDFLYNDSRVIKERWAELRSKCK